MVAEQIKLNLGCGLDYRRGWVNLDFNKEVKADIYISLEYFPWPIESNKFDYILACGILEHITPTNLIKVIEELHRICKPNALIDIYVPHRSGMYAFNHLTHYSFFGLGKFDTFRPEGIFNGERYSKVRFNVKREILNFFDHNIINYRFLSKLPINWIFNFNRTWQMLMERFQFLGFDEIYYQLEVIKDTHVQNQKKSLSSSSKTHIRNSFIRTR